MNNPNLPPGYELIALDDIDSTNFEALRRARAGEMGPIWFWAQSRSHGRGRQGREWVSEPGNLYGSLLLTLKIDPARAAGLSFVAGLALADTLAILSPHTAITLKWPNDVLLNGAKIAGILIETQIQGQSLTIVIGCGVNLAHAPPITRYRATSLADVNVKATPAQALTHLAHAFATRLAQWDEGRNFATIRENWLARAHALGETISLNIGHETLTGCFTTMAADGAIILTLANGETRALHAGEVHATHQQMTETTP